MKVCTDACLFGAWATKQIAKYKADVKTILDIGTGTGLLSLMLGQKFVAEIDAVEIDADAAVQAADNIAASPWKKIQVHNVAIDEFKIEKKYDIIISNPPFFENDLLSPNSQRNTAMHNRYFSFDMLLQSINKHMAPDGFAAVLLPYSRLSYFKELLLKKGLSLVEVANVRQSVDHGCFRSMAIISQKLCRDAVVSELSIHNGQRAYTTEFKELLADYYLNL